MDEDFRRIEATHRKRDLGVRAPLRLRAHGCGQHCFQMETRNVLIGGSGHQGRDLVPPPGV